MHLEKNVYSLVLKYVVLLVSIKYSWSIEDHCYLINFLSNLSMDVSEVLNSPTIIVLLSNSLKSVQFSRSVVSYSLQPHALQHARLPCPSPNPAACSNSCLLS